MKKYLLPQDGNFYKANLHCHTNVSDGKYTPEEVKKAYMEHGYSVVAYTDHDVLVPHPELADENFLPLNGYEMEVNEEMDAPFSHVKTCHMCFVALKKDNVTQACYHRSKYLYANSVKYADVIKYDDTKPDFERVYDSKCISRMMKEGRDNGFFVTYNHPGWSMETYDEYAHYENMHAMEIMNYGCIAAGYTDYNEKEYDDILRTGKRIYCIGADDNHNRAPMDTRDFDSFGCYIMIKAPKLEYETITQALVDGNFYSSMGPAINELWYEDGKIHVTCSEADRIVLNSGIRRTQIVLDETGDGVCEASFDVLPDDVYVRITITDKSGLHANTNAYFVDELL